MDVISQAPQPVIWCYQSVRENEFKPLSYQQFSPNSEFTTGKNLQSYNFSKDIENISGSFSFTVVEDIENIASDELFMDKVKPLDVITISEGGDGIIDFIGVVTTISVGALSSNLTKQVTVSGKSIEYLFQYLNICLDLKAAFAVNNKKANIEIKLDLNNQNGQGAMSFQNIAENSYRLFKEQAGKYVGITNTLILEIIEYWYGSSFIEADSGNFLFPITSNMLEGSKVTFIDFLRKLLPTPVYEIFGYIDSNNHPKLRIRKAPFSNKPEAVSINPALITNFTLTRSCEEMYTAFMPYIEGSSQSADFYMNLAIADGESITGYPITALNNEKIKMYGFQLLTVSFVGFTNGSKAETGFDKGKLEELSAEIKDWYTNLDEMLTGDLTVVNYIKNRRKPDGLIESDKKNTFKDLLKKAAGEFKNGEEEISLVNAKVGNWLGFSGGSFYIQAENHSWNYGDNPMLNFTIGRGGDYKSGKFKPLKGMSAAYKELENETTGNRS